MQSESLSETENASATAPELNRRQDDRIEGLERKAWPTMPPQGQQQPGPQPAPRLAAGQAPDAAKAGGGGVHWLGVVIAIVLGRAVAKVFGSSRAFAGRLLEAFRNFVTPLAEWVDILSQRFQIRFDTS